MPGCNIIFSGLKTPSSSYKYAPAIAISAFSKISLTVKFNVLMAGIACKIGPLPQTSKPDLDQRVEIQGLLPAPKYSV